MTDRATERLRLLFDVSRSLAEQNESSAIFAAILGGVARVVGGGAVLYRWDDETAVLRCLGSQGLAAEPAPVLESGRGLPGEAFQKRQAVVRQSADGSTGPSIAVPLIRAGVAIGVIEARAADRAATIETDDAGMLTLLGDQALAVFATIGALEERRRTVEQIEHLNQSKAAFTSMVSHEFRTPLTGIQGFSEMLRDEALTADEVREYASEINRDAKRLSTMIAELVELDRMEEGRLDLDLEDVDLNEAIRDCVSSMEHTDRVVAELDPAIAAVRADRERLVEMLKYLLENAEAYTDGDRRIEVGTAREDSVAHLWVKDHGDGLPAEALERIFDRFARIDASATKYIRGSSLGLVIAHRLASLHGGRAWAESALGSGSTFHVTLPLST